MEAALQHSGDRLSKLASLLAAAKVAGDKHVVHKANTQDATKWEDIAPPGDRVTEGYLGANRNFLGIASALALHRSQSTAASLRGDLYPFVCGVQKTNSLLFMAEWLAEIHVAQLLIEQKIKALDGMKLVAEYSEFWHTLNALRLLNQWAGPTSASYDIALQITASAKLSGNEMFAAACQNLAHASFILTCPELPNPPSTTMTDRLWNVLVQKTSTDDDLQPLFPAVIDAAILKIQRSEKRYRAAESIWLKLATVADMKVMPSTLCFDI